MAFEEIYLGYVLVDSSALIALLDEKDENHDVAMIALEELKKIGAMKLFICNLTLYETFTHLRYNFGWTHAEQLWNFVSQKLDPSNLEFRVSDEIEAKKILLTYRSHKISFHDASCAALMLTKNIGRVFTFDNDFSIIGFDRYPN